jgi:hypothetical protein
LGMRIGCVREISLRKIEGIYNAQLSYRVKATGMPKRAD